MVVGQHIAARRDADILGSEQRLGDQQVGRRIGFARHGVVAADPGFLETYLIVKFDGAEIVVMPLREVPLRRVIGHQKSADFHRTDLPGSVILFIIAGGETRIARMWCRLGDSNT